MNKLHFGLVAGLACAMPLGLSLPSHAATCRTGAPTSYTLAEISAGGFNCQLGDKIYSDFSFTGFSSGTFVFTNPIPTFHTFQGQALGLGPSTAASYTYKVSIDSVISPTAKFRNFSTTTAVSDIGNGSISTKSLANQSMNTVVSSNGVNSATYTYSPTTTTPIIFTSDISVTEGLLTQFTDVLQQQMNTPAPGPLPILGAGAAFGLSRQLRKRIKSAA